MATFVKYDSLVSYFEAEALRMANDDRTWPGDMAAAEFCCDVEGCYRRPVVACLPTSDDVFLPFVRMWHGVSGSPVVFLCPSHQDVIAALGGHEVVGA